MYCINNSLSAGKVAELFGISSNTLLNFICRNKKIHHEYKLSRDTAKTTNYIEKIDKVLNLKKQNFTIKEIVKETKSNYAVINEILKSQIPQTKTKFETCVIKDSFFNTITVLENILKQRNLYTSEITEYSLNNNIDIPTIAFINFLKKKGYKVSAYMIYKKEVIKCG